LEVLLAALLSVMLVAAIWSLFNIYVNLFDKGEIRTEQAQLVRSVMRQISDDLKSAIQDMASRPPGAPSTTPLRRFGLFGTTQSLKIDIMRTAPEEQDFLPEQPLSPRMTEEAIGPKAPEFCTVEYDFVEPPDSYGLEGLRPTEEEKRQIHAGLTRHELDWEIPGEAYFADSSSRRPLNVSRELSQTATFASAPSNASAEDVPVDSTILYVPEVVSLGFRYFDGKGWTSQWNSIERKSLPAAIEVTMQIEPPETPKARRFEEGESSDHDSASKANNEDARITVHEAASKPAEQEAPLPTHRMVVYLAVSPLQRPPKTVDVAAPQFRVSVPLPVVPTVTLPPVSVPSATIPTPSDRRRVRTPAPADQHIRNQ
jgi:hypothetical protein